MAVIGPPPSFSHEISRARRRRDYPIVAPMLEKVSTRRLLELLEAPIPERFEVIGPRKALRAAHLSEPTVIKPVRGSNNSGVLCLVPLNGSRWRDLSRGDDLTLSGVIDRMASEALLWGLQDEWLVEDLIVNPLDPLKPVRDIKVMTFGPVLGPWFIRRLNPARFRWFEADGSPFDAGIARQTPDPTLEPPVLIDGILATAQRLSSRLRIPHLRIDFLESPDRVIVGELSVYSGWAHQLGAEADVRLGELYEESESRMIRDREEGADHGDPLINDLVARLRPINTRVV
jgi:hypothetical protein